MSFWNKMRQAAAWSAKAPGWAKAEINLNPKQYWTYRCPCCSNLLPKPAISCPKEPKERVSPGTSTS